ncbi:MAG: 16S rRNA (guanine(527)-N(7))-methyltransferase RsmG [Candidatus Ancillula sp.]|jgi:16S rRNA (guanine527-N7)-methyltransferase|nr:16S rRNA (guanine(527)-N(7))-methyltransferase RsmG [Candidatus Ancillula sp.]
MSEEKAKDWFKKDAFSKFDNEKINQFASLLEQEGEIRGLIGPKELPRLWERHLLNSAAPFIVLQNKIKKPISTLVDIGSGAGFPGIVLAILMPGTNIYLVESMHKRCEWLEYVKSKLELNNVFIINERSEDAQNLGLIPPADIVTARAVAALEKLAAWTMPFLRHGGHLLALKGEKASNELEKAKYKLKKFKSVKLENGNYGEVVKVEFGEDLEPTNIVDVRRI